MVNKGHKKAVWITWKYAAGDEAFEGFKESYTKAGGTIIKELGLPFPNVEFQALLTEIAALKPDAVACFFAGPSGAKFMKDFAAAGLKGKIALYGSGVLTEGVLQAAGPAADGVMTTLHYSDSLDTPRNKKFRLEYAKTFKMQPDVYAVQGYHAGLLLLHAANAVKGDLSKKPDLYKAMQGAVIDSPRGKWTMSKTHNPIQDMYLRVVENGENKVIGDRAFGSDAETVEKYISASIRGLQTSNVLACAKHFPGHGDTLKDSHFDLPLVKTSLEMLKTRELVPFPLLKAQAALRAISWQT
jgi:branched-chain amino acid transport system substrate-binding protein